MLLLVANMFAIPSYATTIENSADWVDDRPAAGVLYTSDYDDAYKTKSFEASIAHSKNGEQRVYFNIDYDINDDSDEFVFGRDVADKTIVFNGQAVSLYGQTKRYSNVGRLYYSYTPKTNKGHEYILDILKKSTTPIKVEFENETIYLPVKGFTKRWNTGGGNAI